MASPAELDEIVAGMKVEIPLHPESERKLSFKTFQDLNSYIDAERAFWQPTRLDDMRNAFNNALSQLKQAQEGDVRTARNKIAEALAALNSNIVHSGTAQGQFLKNLSTRDGAAAVAAWAYFRGSLPTLGGTHLNSSSGLDGAVAALLFKHPELRDGAEASQITAFQAQRTAIDAFRGDIETLFRALKADAKEWKKSDQEEAAKLLKEQKEAFEAQIRVVDSEHKAQEATIAKWIGESQQKIADLETIYREKLRLEKPAEYWNQLEKKYVRQGVGGTVATLLLVAGIARWVSVLVYRPPAIFIAEKLTFGGLKGAILVAAAISGLLYLTNLLVKIATSSFHLARDARERYQLTHVYLALKQEGAMEDKEREIILSALFSRSDTGLLKGDSGPNFPPTPLSSILEHLAKR